MSGAARKMVQCLHEAHATERALIRALQSQIALAPPGRHRDGLEAHLRETREHAERVERRLGALDQGLHPLQAGIDIAQSVLGRALEVGRAPVDLARGGGGAGKVLDNAKDACATEALEIAIYTAIEHLASTVADATTARLATSIRAEEERMLERLLSELPALTDAAVGVPAAA